MDYSRTARSPPHRHSLPPASPTNDTMTGKANLFNRFKRSDWGTRSTLSLEGDISARRQFRASGQSAVVPASIDNLSEDDVIIAVMGPTGAGKSSFINTATGGENIIGHNLESCTTEISVVHFQCPERSDLDVLFVDTPGFDDTNKSDVEILNLIANWLKTTYHRNVKLSGILYFHRISDNRMAGTPLKNLRMFEKLCGKNALKNIILITTMWDEVDDVLGLQREKQLKDHYWKGMLEQGSKTVHYRNTPDSAWDIIDHYLQTANQRYAVLLQQEMVDMEKQLRETQAGQALFATLEALVRKQQEMLQNIREETKRHADDNVVRALREDYEALRQQLAVTMNEMHTLKIPLGRRLLRLLTSPLGVVDRRTW